MDIVYPLGTPVWEQGVNFNATRVIENVMM